MASNQTPKRKRGTPAGDSLSAKTKIGHKMALVHRRLSLLGNGGSSSKHLHNDDGFGPTDEELGIVVGQQSKAVDDRDDPDYKVEFVPLRRKRERPVGSKSAKSKKEKKPTLVEKVDFELEVSDDDGGKKHARVNAFYGSAWDKAVELNEKLPAEGPSFVKLMLKSHVVKGFWLGLPRSFCRNHLPDHDVTITLEDEEGNIYATNYLANRTGLSGGWNGFAVVNELNVGDAVVFQLVTLTRFKVYIVRETKFTKTDGALGLDTSLGSNTPEGESSDEDGDVNSEEDPEATRFSCNAFGNGRHNNLDSEEADDDGLRSPDPDTDFSAVKSFRDFNIVLDGLDIEPELFPDRLSRMYYQLCCARKAFLHIHLLKHISPGLAAGLIVETANIAEGIRASHASSSSHEDLSAWKTILQSLELAGMDVAFLRKRVDELHVAAEKMRALKLKMSSLNDALKDLCIEAEEMVEWIAKKKRKEEQAMRELATTPWWSIDNMLCASSVVTSTMHLRFTFSG